MQAKVTTRGVFIPKTYFPGVKTVEIRQAKNGILVVPLPTEDPILQLGKNPVEDVITDAAANHDRYLYRQ